MANTATASASEFSSASSTGGSGFETSNFSGIGGGAVAGGGRASFYESSSSSYSGDTTGFGGSGGATGDFGPTSYESSYRSSVVGLPGGINAGAAFAAADTNNDGVLSLQEFRNAGY